MSVPRREALLEPRAEGAGAAGAPVCTAAAPPPPEPRSASLASALFNLVLAVLGAGQLTLPYALSQLGLTFGLGQLVVFTLLGVHSLHTLSVYALHFSAANGGEAPVESYPALVVRVFGEAGSGVCSVLLAAYAWGGAVSFMIILKEQLGFLFSKAGTAVSGRWWMAAVSLVIIWPLSSLQNTASLKRFSPLGCIAAIFITCVVLACTRWAGDGGVAGAMTCEGPRGTDSVGEGSVAYWPGSFLAVTGALPLLPFALNSSWAYLPILDTMRGKTAARVHVLIAVGSAVIFANYALISAYGYLTFCGSTSANIMDSLNDAAAPGSPTEGLVLVAKAALSVQLTLALPMRFFVARTTIAAAAGDAAAGAPQRALLALALVGLAAALAATDVSLAVVLGITSSVCASSIIYILPSAMDLKLRLPGPIRKAVSVVSLAVGLFVMFTGLVANVLGVAVGG